MITMNSVTTVTAEFVGKYSISGTVQTPASSLRLPGSPIVGVTMTLSGDATGTVTTDTNGNYTFTGLSSGSYMITPSRTDYAFIPTSMTPTINGANVTGQSFTGKYTGVATFSISGAVTSGSSPLSGVTMTLSGAASKTTTSDANGNYSFAGLSNGSYTITPSKTGYTFTPPNRSVTVNSSNVTGQDFSATASGGGSYSISGQVIKVTLGRSTALSGVTITLSGAISLTTTTDTNGNYSFTGLANDTYTITPSKTGYIFTPENISVTISGANVTRQIFTGVYQ